MVFDLQGVYIYMIYIPRKSLPPFKTWWFLLDDNKLLDTIKNQAGGSLGSGPVPLDPSLPLEEMIEAEWLDDVRWPQKHMSMREYFTGGVEAKGATTRAGVVLSSPNTDPLMRAPQGGFVNWQI